MAAQKPPFPRTTTIKSSPLTPRYASLSLSVYLNFPFRFPFSGGSLLFLSAVYCGGCSLPFYYAEGGGRRTRPLWHLTGKGLDGGGCGSLGEGSPLVKGICSGVTCTLRSRARPVSGVSGGVRAVGWFSYRLTTWSWWVARCLW